MLLLLPFYCFYKCWVLEDGARRPPSYFEGVSVCVFIILFGRCIDKPLFFIVLRAWQYIALRLAEKPCETGQAV